MSRYPDITLDFNNMMKERVGSGGIDPSEIDRLLPSIQQAYRGLVDLRKLGQLPYQDLPYQEDLLENLIRKAREIRENYDSLLLLGTGGSSLGAAFLLNALTTQGSKEKFPIEICEDLHPVTWQRMADRFSRSKTLMVVVSKSGKTTETLAAFLFFRKWMIENKGDKNYKKSVLFVTDPHQGPLRKIAKDEGIETLPVPPGVGGRYSILSNVGLLPSACVGIDIKELMAGARRMDERCQKEEVWMNPAMMSATLHFLAGTERKRQLRVIMPYEDRLKSYTDWFAQLWAESLGKLRDLRGNEIRAGSTPIKAAGSIDQHSQLQMYLQGPQDKTVTFLTSERQPVDHRIPQEYDFHPEFRLLANKTAGQLVGIQKRATEAALCEAGCPNLTIEMKEINPYTIGQLLYMAEVETVFAGALYNINPFDQPGVELIKNYVKGLLGAEDFREYRQKLDAKKKDPRFTI